MKAGDDRKNTEGRGEKIEVSGRMRKDDRQRAALLTTKDTAMAYQVTTQSWALVSPPSYRAGSKGLKKGVPAERLVRRVA
jgi:hypothetical protein